MLRNSAASYGFVAIAFHWVMAILFLIQFWIGLTMMGIVNPLEKFALYQRHKSFGFLILGLVMLRLLWSLANRRPALPATMKESERQLAKASHALLYLALFAIPLTGWAVVSTSPLPIASWFFGLFTIPRLPLTISLHSQQIWGSVHGLLAYSALFLAGIHALAALRHHFHHRDDVLKRMLWPRHGNQD
ncbi:cytochrome b [Rhizobium alvei]|uniref:Cytochrome b n=1 Tax=Rhizobium alvei TaxID=1132659 RepID=A0ABT8YJG0_9HYPH|nr:cytochrome b [Rhizobium alvei]MDO6963838.1 cytochrome b [Rhizobium alvei]